MSDIARWRDLADEALALGWHDGAGTRGLVTRLARALRAAAEQADQAEVRVAALEEALTTVANWSSTAAFEHGHVGVTEFARAALAVLPPAEETQP